MKQLLTLLFLLICATGFSQILKNTNLNLNAGGVIYDVAYDSYYDAYVVVGDFSSINGQPRNNLAFIDANSLGLMSQTPITGINGVIRSVEVVNDVSTYNVTLGLGERHFIYLGGDFTTVNSQTRVQVAQLQATHYYGNPPAGGFANFVVSPWNAQFNDVGGHGVNDLLLYGDTLMVVGEFFAINPTYYPTGTIGSVVTFKADQIGLQTHSAFLQPYSSMGYNSGPMYRAKLHDDQIYLLGYTGVNTFIERYDMLGNEDVSFSITLYQVDASTTDGIWDIEFFDNASSGQLFISYDDKFGTPASGTYRYNESGGVAVPNVYNYPVSPLSDIGSEISIESYKNLLFGISSSRFYSHRINNNATIDPELVVNQLGPINGGWYDAVLSNPPTYVYDRMHVIDNRLLISGEGLTSVNAQTRNGLAVYCLEPRDADLFTTFDNTACEGDSSIYTIPQTEFADGYRWSYTGAGAMYRVTGTGTAWTPLVSEILSGTNANSIEVYFPVGTTGGTLTVEPFSVCNTSTDYQYSEGQSNVISINPVPDIILAPTHTLNCYADTLHMVVQTTMPNVDFQWFVNGMFFNNDSILITETLNSYPDSTYQVTLTNTITGCVSTGGTLYTTELVADPMDISLVSTNPLEWTCLTDSMVVTSNQTGYTVLWENQASTGTYYSDPLIIDTVPNGVVYNMYGTQISNGCSTQEAFGGIVVNELEADGMLVGYNYQSSSTPIDTINCSNSSIVLQCDVTAPFSSNSVAEWLDGNGIPTGSDILNVSQADANGSNFQVFTFRTTNNDNGCTQDYDVLVWFELDIPFVDQIADETLNCSQSDIVLSHPINGLTNITEGWLDGTGVQTGVDTLLVTSVGEYYYQVTDTISGCSNVDTVNVTQTLDLDLDMPSDTLICPDEIVSISPIVIGNTETPSYLWSTGSTSATETATGGIDSELSVTITTPSGCTGTDTTLILITAPISATITPFAACTDGSLEVTSVSGGAGNYQYSLDGTTWQTSTNFPNLVFDDYTISIQDDLGCIYDFNQSLDGTASSVEMQFTASTYNEEGDTIVLVNITDFTGLDSVSWVFPNNANVTYEDDSIVILSIATGGWYDVELIGYIGTDCEYSFMLLYTSETKLLFLIRRMLQTVFNPL
jgi:hypothetical protein